MARSFQQQLAAFMHAIGKQESGGRYGVLGPQTKYGRPRGKYQILDSNWDAWARAAGIPGANWQNPAAQERVAAYMFTRYYKQFGGRWDAVAVAWFAGPGRARSYVENPASVGRMKDVLGTSVFHYVNKAMATMQDVTGPDIGQLVGDAGIGFDPQVDASLEARASTTVDAFRSLFEGSGIDVPPQMAEDVPTAEDPVEWPMTTENVVDTSAVTDIGRQEQVERASRRSEGVRPV